MAAAVALSVMLTAARQRANQETLDQSQALVTDAEATSHINYALEQIYSALVMARRGYYRATPQTITTIVGQSSYALQADFLEAISVDWQFSTSEVVPIAEYNEAERNRYKMVAGWYRNQPIAWQLQGNKINFIPVPQATQTVIINYVPVFNPLVNPGDTFDGVIGFENYAIWKVAGFLAMKDDNETLAAYCEQQAAGEMQRTKSMAKNRTGMAPRVQRVRKFRRLGWVT